MKAVIATDVIFIIVFIGLVVGASLIVFWKWYSDQKTATNELTCQIKQKSYCLDIIAGKQPNWNEIPPTSGCENFNVVQPTEEECKKFT